MIEGRFGGWVGVVVLQRRVGSEFVEWTGDCSGSGACEVRMDEAHSVKAVFELEGRVLLSLIKGGHAEGGTVPSSPAGIDCGTGCEVEAGEFREGETVNLTVSAASGYVFGGWLNCKYVSAGVCQVTLSGPLTEVTAVFLKDGEEGEGVAVTLEAPGAKCVAGGVKVESSSGTEYVCNGEEGGSGADGADGNNGQNGNDGAAVSTENGSVSGPEYMLTTAEVEAACGSGTVASPDAEPGYLCVFAGEEEEIEVDATPLFAAFENPRFISPSPTNGAVVPFTINDPTLGFESTGGHAKGSWALNTE